MTSGTPFRARSARSLILAQDVLAGNRLALARLLTHIENETPDGRAALAVALEREATAVAGGDRDVAVEAGALGDL